jgi:hypothetical protein
MDALARQLLEQTRYQCEFCSEIFSYGEKDKHKVSCKGINIFCPVDGCKQGFQTAEDARAHLLECGLLQIECSACQTLLIGNAVGEHTHQVCNNAMKALIKPSKNHKLPRSISPCDDSPRPND